VTFPYVISYTARKLFSLVYIFGDCQLSLNDGRYRDLLMAFFPLTHRLSDGLDGLLEALLFVCDVSSVGHVLLDTHVGEG